MENFVNYLSFSRFETKYPNIEIFKQIILVGPSISFLLYLVLPRNYNFRFFFIVSRFPTTI